MLDCSLDFDRNSDTVIVRLGPSRSVRLEAGLHSFGTRSVAAGNMRELHTVGSLGEEGVHTYVGTERSDSEDCSTRFD